MAGQYPINSIDIVKWKKAEVTKGARPSSPPGENERKRLSLVDKSRFKAITIALHLTIGLLWLGARTCSVYRHTANRL